MTYRFPRGRLVGLFAVFVVGPAVVLVTQKGQGRLAEAGFAAVCAVLLVLLARSGTTIGEQGVRVRGVVRTRVFRWSEITDLRLAPTGSPMSPTRTGVVLHTGAERVKLPYLNDFRLRGTTRLAAELARIRAVGRR